MSPPIAGSSRRDPATREEWARARAAHGRQGHPYRRMRHPAAAAPKPRGVFVNTWSVEGFISEGLQPAELGWGTHEKHMPPEGKRHAFGPDCAIYLMRPGAGTRVRSWTPTAQGTARLAHHP